MRQGRAGLEVQGPACPAGWPLHISSTPDRSKHKNVLDCTEWRDVRPFQAAAACCGTDEPLQMPAASGSWRSLHKLLVQLLF